MKRRIKGQARLPSRPAKAARREEHSPSPAKRKRHFVAWAIAGAAVLAAAWNAYSFWAANASAESLLKQAQQALAAKDYVAAEECSLRLVGSDGPSAPALLVAGEAAARQGRLSDALGYYAQLPADAGEEAALGYTAAGDLLLQMHHASAAEAQFCKALAIDPQLHFAHEHLGYLLGIEGRRWESLPHLFMQLRSNQFSEETLILLGNHAAAIDQTAELEKFRQAAPDDPLPLLGMARLAFRQTRMEEAKGLLKQVLARAPNQIEALAQLGQVLLAQDDPELDQWLVEEAPKAEAHPEVWMTRGMWAKQRGHKRGAARSFWEAIKRDPAHQAATYQLAQSLAILGDSDVARQLSDRAAQLQKLAGLMDTLFVNRNNLGALREAAKLTESLGFVWEACAWHEVILNIDPQATASRQSIERLLAILQTGAPLVLDEANPAKRIDFASYPLPRWSANPRCEKPSTPRLASSRTSFADLAARAGIDFQYSNGSGNDEEDRQIFRIPGGGIAVLDYDADGWPDIYLTQGCSWPPVAGQSEQLDRLFRNLGDGTFEDVTVRSLLAEDRFSQGVAAGDFNDDGFADLYVANIGANRLYMNHGDGTFRDVSAEAGIDGETWTTSCLLADLNGDGLCDIYDVNYVQGYGVFERICPQKGKPRTCAPTVFEPQADRFYLNLGDGRFAERTEVAGLNAGGGNGFGIVAGDLDGSGRLSLFVANDQDANFYFANETAAPGAAPQFIERGVLSGLAYDGDGKALACMGIAAGDANEDGKLDLFVTNFYQESNTLYLQDSDGMFIDSTASSGLRTPSYRMLGFGAQFIDGELDGHPDLILTNGHVEDLSSLRVPYRMPPQYFRGLGGGRFQELPAAGLGEFFQGEYLGRSLARIDWNRDGREDVVIAHLKEPVALLSNTSAETGHFLAVQLRGVQSSRDAIGACVAITAGGRPRRQWLTAGDGYQASNQRQLIFGLGSQRRVKKLQIRWPSGLTQEFSDLAADQELIFIEGSPRATRMPRDASSPDNHE